MSGKSEAIPKGYKATELGLLPEDWGAAPLGSVADLVMGQSPPGATYNDTGEGQPFLQGKAEFGQLSPTHVKYTTQPLKTAPEGSVLLSVRAPVGDVNIADIDYCIGRGLASISLRDGENRFLFYAMLYRKQALADRGSGSTFTAVNKSTLTQFEIPLPPLREQKKIAAVLATVQDAREKTDASIAALRELRRSLMKHLFTYGPVPVDEAEKVKLKETELGELPEHWQCEPLGQHLETIRNGLTAKQNKAGKGYPVTRIETISEDRVNPLKVGYAEDASEKDQSKYRMLPNDILLSHINSEPQLGRTAMYEGEPEVLLHGMNLLLLRPKKSMDPAYLHYTCCMLRACGQFIRLASRAVGQSSINQGKLKRQHVPVPPLSAQKAIAGQLRDLEGAIEATENRKQALESLFKTLLHDLMTAKIRVNDLPAEQAGVEVPA
ncbi:MAG: restriction endonuclease subunit S [Phycisphaerae bacterium]